MATDQKPAAFNQEGARRVVRATQIVERAYRLPPLPRPTSPVGDFTGQVAKVKTTVGARSGQTAGTGTVTFQVLNDAGVYVDGATDVPVKNPYATELTVGKWVTVVPASGGLTIFGADC